MPQSYSSICSSCPGRLDFEYKSHVAPTKTDAALLEITFLSPPPARGIGVVFAANENAALNTAIQQFRMCEADWPKLMARRV